jgi:hypothetical protein
VNRYLAINIEGKIGQPTVIRTSSFINSLYHFERIIEILGLRPSNRLPVSYFLPNPGIDETIYVRGSPSQNTVSSRNPKNTLVRRSSVGSFVERDFFIRTLFQVYFNFA